MTNFHYDLCVIGAGSAGVRAARIAAEAGAKVAIAEAREFGGTCVNVGCVPKKLFFYAAHFREDFDIAKSFGWDIKQNVLHWERLRHNKDKEIKRLNGIYRQRLDKAGVDIIMRRALILDEHTVQVDNKKITAKYILIATGGWPNKPNIPGREYSISSNEVFFLEALPEKIIIVGGGYIAVEFASIFNGLGVDTTLVYRNALFLNGFDKDLRQRLMVEMQKKGIHLRFETTIAKIEQQTDRLIAIMDDGERLSAGQMMYAIGRHPNTSCLDLDKVPIQLDENKAIVVNKNYQTNIPSIYAIGDVSNSVQLTPVAIAEGEALARHLFHQKPIDCNDIYIPTCVFSQPNLGTVGLIEEKAREQYTDIDIYISSFRSMKNSLSDFNETTFMKLIVDQRTDRVVGAHMLGLDAGEIIQGISIAMQAGATKKDFDSTIAIHPTTAEEFVTMKNKTR